MSPSVAVGCSSWISSACCVAGIYSLSWMLNLVLPGRRRKGLAKDCDGEPLVYTVNGPQCVLVGFALLFVVTCIVPGMTLDYPVKHAAEMAAVACAVGLVLSIILFAIGKWPGHVSAHTGKMSAVARFFFGTELNPRWMGVDIKMWLYLIGVFMLMVNVLSGVAFYYNQHGGHVHTLLLVYAGELLWFCCDYLVFEDVQLSTYDLFAENVGFKLAWGCLFFYPFFYCIGMWPFLSLPEPDDLHTGTVGDPFQNIPFQAFLSVFVFLCGWFLSRGANLQKYNFKMSTIRRRKFYFIQQESIAGKILASGFWGVSRHVNYLGEILMAVGMALCGGLATPFTYLTVLPWLYPLYYVVLLVMRERDDDRRCAEKYGSLWAVYRKRVPYRIVPYIY